MFGCRIGHCDACVLEVGFVCNFFVCILPLPTDVFSYRFDFCHAMATDADLYNAVDAFGVHYPGTNSNAECVSLNKPLWSSEDYSSYGDSVGAGCWARILNQNYVNGMMIDSDDV